MMWVALEGLIGAGKTTTAALWSESFGRPCWLEPSDKHPFLEKYYLEPSRYLLETEIAFMLLQRHQILQADHDHEFISDYAPAKNLVFAGLVGTRAELGFLKSVDRELWSGLPNPDLVVFLDVPIEVCLARIAERGRAYEAGITGSALEQLRASYGSSLASLGKSVRVMALRGTETPAEVAEAVSDLIGS